MNVLLYNFLQPGEASSGGVNIYINNLSKALQAAGHRVIALSSGDVFTMLNRKPRLRNYSDTIDRSIIVNSPLVAPAQDAFENLSPYSNSRELDQVPQTLYEIYGSIDVFHFHNLEGLTYPFFKRLRVMFPAARMLLSLHNYNVVCPQVDLWFQGRELCVDYRNGVDCTVCMPNQENSLRIRRTRRYRPLTRMLAETAPLIRTVRRLLSAGLKKTRDAAIGPVQRQEGDGRQYVAFRQTNIDLCRDVFDQVLAVSERTRDVVVARGLSPSNISISYIGTQYKAVFEQATKILDVGANLHVAYLGYMRRSKGFNFFLDVLDALPDTLARSIIVTVAAKNAEQPDEYARLLANKHRYAGFHYYDGFTHKTIDSVLQGVNLGIVPPLWEDNLPQVAIEIVARGIPLLTSDRGGAQEIASNPEFVFKAGSIDSAVQRLQALSNRDIPLARFWSNPTRIYSMDEHVADLMAHYAPTGVGSLSSQTADINPPEAADINPPEAVV